VASGFIWAGLRLDAATGSLGLNEIPNTRAEELLAQLKGALYREQADRQLSACVPALLAWARAHQQAIEQESRSRGWLSREFVETKKVAAPLRLLKLWRLRTS
jgi:hypothetical protein